MNTLIAASRRYRVTTPNYTTAIRSHFISGCATTFVNASCVSDYYRVGCRQAGHVLDVRTSAAQHLRSE